MGSWKVTSVIAVSAAAFAGMGITCAKLTNMLHHKEGLGICILAVFVGAAMGLTAVSIELESKRQKLFVPPKKKNTKDRTKEAYAAPDKE